MTIDAHLHRRPAAADQPVSALTSLTNGRHAWAADVDRTLGSSDAAPSPHDLLDSALAACTTLTLELYIRRKALAVRSLHVQVDHVETRGDDGGVRYQMQRRIHIDGDLAEADRTRLLEIAGKCPIHRVLEGQTRIETTLT